MFQFHDQHNKQTTWTNPVCARRVNHLVCSLPLHRHSYIGFILAFASSIHNKHLFRSLTYSHSNVWWLPLRSLSLRRRWQVLSLRKRMLLSVSSSSSQWVGWGRSGLTVGMSMGAQLPVIAEKPLATCGCRKFQLDPLGDEFIFSFRFIDS